ncbi:MAG: type IIL restriction-modification enzyme MmeI [Microcoleaceae cyanobacterium]
MSIPRHHTEWLSLVEASGPFLTLQVLMDAFPQGLEAHDAEHYRLLKQVYPEWLAEQQDKAIHREWVKWVLQNTLEFPDEVLCSGQQIPAGLSVTLAEHQETLRPDWIIVNPDNKQPRLLIQYYPPNQNIEKPLKTGRWKASPAIRMMELLHGVDVRLGLITNGEQWMLVNAPRGETSGFISWYSNLWQEEKITLRAFRSLLGVRRFFAVEDDETLEALLAKSKDAQQEITDQLGYQVRRAVEVLVQKIDKIDQDMNRQLLQAVTENELYQAALFVMMRLVFLFTAEERDLLLLGDRLYDQFYAVSTLRAELRQQADQFGEEILERRCDAWYRLLATFRAIYGGIGHDELRLPAYGGRLFNPDTFPFLEGRLPGTHWQTTHSQPIPIDNRTVLHLLEALQVLQVSVPGGGKEARRLSFRALDVEQIGHVYEGLLDHTAIKAESPVLGLTGTKNSEPEVPLADLQAAFNQGEKEFLKQLKKWTGRTPTALRKAYENGIGGTMDEQRQLEGKFRIACNNDAELWQHIKPFAGLVRLDTFGYPVVIPTGSVYVSQGSDRRETGTHYTPRSLTEEIVRYTLEPLVYPAVAAGKPKADWKLISAHDLLQLKICDFAMGSGAFLVQVCRYLGERLVEAWEIAEAANPGKIVIAPEGELSQSRPEECIIPQEPEERLIVAKRIIAERCIYGVDKNPLAVEMAKLSLWLETLQQRKPFTFLDHALKCGDSLIGVTIQQLQAWNLDVNSKEHQQVIATDLMQREIEQAIQLRLQLEALPGDTIQAREEKENKLKEAEYRLKDLRDRANLLIQSYLANVPKKEQEPLRRRLLMVAQSQGDITAAEREKLPNLEQLHPFHWELEFPEVFLQENNKGFHALVGNPPFMGGSKITGILGTPYREFIVEWLANKKGNADLCAYFFLRGKQLIQENCGYGLVATNTISQGYTREVGLDQLVQSPLTPLEKESPLTPLRKGGDGIIYRAIPSKPWEGTASLEVAYVWLRKGEWQGEYVLNDQAVNGITPFLTIPGKAAGNPYRLAENQSKSFLGSKIDGQGFVLTPEEAQALIDKNPKNKEVLFPYLNGQDLNSNPDQSPSRWVINFFDYPLDAEHDDLKKPKGAPYAVDYPDCLEIVERLVKPEREEKHQKVNNQTNYDSAKRWWQFKRPTIALYEAIANMERVLVISETTKYYAFSFCQANIDIVFSHMTKIIILSNNSDFSVLSSDLHNYWVISRPCKLGKGPRYMPTDCFETFPFPTSTASLEDIGERYYQHRQTIMKDRQEGLTKTYNRFHDPDETDSDIQQLRELHIEMDIAVAKAYGWEDLNLEHDFHDTKQGLRFTISEAARREILDRLLLLNHQRYQQEVEAGLHNKKKKKKKASPKPKQQVKTDPEFEQKSLF